jgi:hypothetical protein
MHGAGQIEGRNGDEICYPDSCDSVTEEGRPDQNRRRYINIIKIKYYFKF